jgi:hypothetical protein
MYQPVGLYSNQSRPWQRLLHKIKASVELLVKHKIDNVVTLDKKHSNNDIQGPKEEDKEQQSTTNTIF